jgi:hypothetical protein
MKAWRDSRACLEQGEAVGLSLAPKQVEVFHHSQE